MALMIKRKMTETFLDLSNPEEGLFPLNHILEPEFHQQIYVRACEDTRKQEGSFRLSGPEVLHRQPNRGLQPQYADDENDPSTLAWEGMVVRDGTRLTRKDGGENVCALKSACIRYGFIDTSLARSVSRDFFKKNEARAAVQRDDLLINSTGDGTIGRVAVYNYDFPAVVDGHITIVRFKKPFVAWYAAAFLLSETGQRQLYRYINGSSGQVEIYPQDIERIWIKPAQVERMKKVGKTLQLACERHDEFYRDLRAALSMV